MLPTKYLLVGSWNTGVAFLVFIFLQFHFVPPLTNLESILATYAISLPNSYLMQRSLVWNSKSQVQSEFAKFAFVSFTQLLLNLILIQLATKTFGLPVIPSQFFVVGFLALITFVVMKKWTFVSQKNLVTSFNQAEFDSKGI